MTKPISALTDEELLNAGLDHLGVQGAERSAYVHALAEKIRGWRERHEPESPKVTVLESACPFCGHRLGYLLVEHGEGLVTGLPRITYTVVCAGCAGRGPWQKTEDGARWWWNLRSAPDPRDPRELLALEKDDPP